MCAGHSLHKKDYLTLAALIGGGAAGFGAAGIGPLAGLLGGDAAAGGAAGGLLAESGAGGIAGGTAGLFAPTATQSALSTLGSSPELFGAGLTAADAAAPIGSTAVLGMDGGGAAGSAGLSGRGLMRLGMLGTQLAGGGQQQPAPMAPRPMGGGQVVPAGNTAPSFADTYPINVVDPETLRRRRRMGLA